MKAAAFCLTMILVAPAWVRADAVTTWNANAAKAALASCIAPGDDPLHEGRMYAMMHVAIHDALNAIDRRSRPYIFDDHARAMGLSRRRGRVAARHVMVPVIEQIPSRRSAFRLASRASRRTTRPRSPQFPPVLPSRWPSRSGRPPQRPFLRCAKGMVPTRLCRTSTTSKVLGLVSPASRLASTSCSPRDGATSRRSC